MLDNLISDLHNFCDELKRTYYGPGKQNQPRFDVQDMFHVFRQLHFEDTGNQRKDC